MGQPVTVVQKPSSKPGVVRFEINRSITGMGHERYRADQEVSGDRPPDRLARTLIEEGGVAGVHINSNVITVDLGKGGDASSLLGLIENMFIYYAPGVEVPAFPTDDAE